MIIEVRKEIKKKLFIENLLKELVKVNRFRVKFTPRLKNFRKNPLH